MTRTKRDGLLALKARLPRTWAPFFARHGNLTPIQQRAIPSILTGESTLVMAATASGKTEAVIAPLLERYCPGPVRQSKGPRPPNRLRILYICPTRALVRDLYERLRGPFAALELSLAMKSGDTGPVSIRNAPTVLITTPESTDSLLTRAPRLLTQLQAIVLDEIHLFDGGPRGDHLRCLLRRIEIVRGYHQRRAQTETAPRAPFGPARADATFSALDEGGRLGRGKQLQCVALSATVLDPARVADRYLTSVSPDGGPTAPPAIAAVAGKRELDATIAPMTDLDDLAAALTERVRSVAGIRKTLLFCNTRNEVEQTAAFLRAHLGYDAAVFAHYSNLDHALRLEVEEEFAVAPVAVCVSTSTLELGIDIGSVDEVALIGPPPSPQSFLQRIGRGGRRTGITRVLCLARSKLEDILFQALIALADRTEGREEETFLPSVLVQQTFSILKQSPTGAIRLADLRRVAPVSFDDGSLRSILDHLSRLDFLRRGRLGEWRPGPALDDLVDAHEIYSNIGRIATAGEGALAIRSIGSDPLALTLVDAFSGRALAHTHRRRTVGEVLQLGGRTLRVVWQDRYRIGVERIRGAPPGREIYSQTAPYALPLEVGQAVAAWAGLQSAQIATVTFGKSANCCGRLMSNLQVAEGTWLFHFWGELYGELLREILQIHYPTAKDSAPVRHVNEHCLYLPGPMRKLPDWNENAAYQALHRLAPRFEAVLDLGRFHSLLPPALAQETVVARCDFARFRRIYCTTDVVEPSPLTQEKLESLLT